MTHNTTLNIPLRRAQHLSLEGENKGPSSLEHALPASILAIVATCMALLVCCLHPTAAMAAEQNGSTLRAANDYAAGQTTGQVVKNTSGTVAKYTTDSFGWALFTFNISGVSADSDVDFVSDEAKTGNSWVKTVEDGAVTLYVYGAGTHNVKLDIDGSSVTCTAVLRQVSLKKTPAVKNTGSVVTYPKQKSKLVVGVSGVKNPEITWTSTNKKIATVSKKGVVKAKAKGRCYVKATVGDVSMKVMVEVTSKKAYKAVLNGFKDMRKKLTYSQPNRMSKTSRDCSSFVSRCYWDSSLGRRIFKIGGEGAASWAYNAAAQASWLNSAGKRVSWKACSLKKLRPGDTVYFETDYAGKDASQWRYIDHAGLYVGNGLILNTGGYGGKGTVGLRSYWTTDKSIKFIGRPCK